MDSIVLGGGCFWCLDAVFSRLEGVESVVSGYAGGSVPNPTYAQVCSGTTGHAEVVKVTFDSSVISREDLLTIFFTLHDPTTPNRQGADVGTQYRSVIFYASDEEKAAAQAVIAKLTADQLWPAPIVTKLEPLTEFYQAEDYHQNYFALNPDQPYCQVVIQPKVAKLRALYANRLRPD